MVQALPLLESIEASLRSDRDAHESLSRSFEDLWRRESKPYALDRALARHAELLAKYDAELERLARARTNAKPDRPLPTPREAGLELTD